MTNGSRFCGLLTNLIRPIMGILVIIDIVLGGVSVFAPRLYMRVIHPDAVDDPVYLLQRAGVIWLGYLVIQAIAFFSFKRHREWVLIVAWLRLVEVPADLVYVQIGAGIGWFGTFGLYAAPVFNLIVGILLLIWYYRCRASGGEPT